jgi:hypothetical protein
VAANDPVRRDTDAIDAGKRIIRASEQGLHRDTRKTGVFLPRSGIKTGDQRVRYQSISIPPHTLSACPVM